MLTDVAINAMTGECNNFGDSAKGCAVGCAAGMGLGWLTSKLPGLAKKAWDAIGCATGFNSFAADTLVHVKPDEAMAGDAKAGKSRLKPINQINVGDEVLSFAEWKDKGKSGKMDRRLSYEKVTDVYTSYKAQTLVRLTLDDGQTLTATDGHPFKTADGWRDAIMLNKDGKLLLKGGDIDTDAGRTATVAEVRTEQRTLPVLNLEVANAHTYFVGVGGELVHNTSVFCNKGLRNGHLAGSFHPKTLITFDKKGFPDFSSVSVVDVKITQTGSYAGDFRAANKAAGFERTPEGYTWNHHQDLTTMQLVPRDIHAQTGHTGGFIRR